MLSTLKHDSAAIMITH